MCLDFTMEKNSQNQNIYKTVYFFKAKNMSNYKK